MEVAFIGLGSMGLPIARNVLKQGHSMTVYNRTRERSEILVAEGARISPTPSGAVASAEIVFTMLSDDTAVSDIVFGTNGIVESPSLHVSLSAISVDLAKRLDQSQKNYLSCPVFGRPEAAAAAQLLLVAAGKPDRVQRVQSILEKLGRKLFVVGEEPWQANAIKIAGNFTIAAMLETLAEALALVRKSGIDPHTFLEIVGTNLFRSPVYENYGRAMADGKFSPAGFKMHLGLKDIRLALAAADGAQTPMPLASLLHDQFLSGVARGHGELDWCALAKVIADDAGVPY